MLGRVKSARLEGGHVWLDAVLRGHDDTRDMGRMEGAVGSSALQRCLLVVDIVGDRCGYVKTYLVTEVVRLCA